MKNILFLLIISFFIINSKSAMTQGVNITPFYGYQFGGQFNANEGRLNIKDTDNFGVIIDIEVPLRKGLFAEIYYSRQKTVLEIQESSFSPKEDIFDMITEYYHAGGLYEEIIGKFRPFGMAGIGITRFHPLEVNIPDEYRFSANITFGAIIQLFNRLGLRIQASLLMPMQLNDGSIFCHSGTCSITLSGGTVILQGNVFAGLTIFF
jgi:hypothetical protein